MTRSKKCTVHPIWNETFYFPASDPQPHGRCDSYLTLQVFDHDNLSTDDFLGQCSVCLDGVSAVAAFKDGASPPPLATQPRGGADGSDRIG